MSNTIIENNTNTEKVEHTIEPNVENIDITTNNTAENIDITTDNTAENTETTESLEKEQNSPKILENTSSEPINIEIEEANTTNCLALTIQKDHKIVAVKNVVLKSLRMSWKVIISTITLGIIKLFS